MKTIHIFFLIAVLLLLAVSCSNTASDSETLSLENESEYGDLPSEASQGQTSLTIQTDQEAYSRPVDEITLRIKNTGSATIHFGEGRYLEKAKNGTWYQIPYENMTFADIGLSMEPGSVHEQDMPLEFIEYPLTAGHYRITKSFWVDEEQLILAAEFTVVEK